MPTIIAGRPHYEQNWRRKAGKQASEPVAIQPVRKTAKVKVEDLVKAKRIVSQMGGVEHALAVLHALKAFER